MLKIRQLTTKFRAAWIGLTLTLTVIFVQFAPFELISITLSRADGLLYDLRLKAMLTPREKGLAEVLIVDIDEKTMDSIGWPWPRARLADLVNKLTEAGTVVIAFDVLFAEPERNPAQVVADYLQQNGADNSTVKDLLLPLDGDQTFADSLSQTDVLLGYLLQHQADVRRGQLPEHAIVTEVPVTDKFTTTAYNGYVSSLPLLHQASAGAGFINSSPDSDGFLRRSSLVNRLNDKLYPSLSLEAARLYALAENIQIDTEQLADQVSVKGVKIGNQLIPTDAEGRVLIPYRGPQRSFPYISAIDILNDDFDPTPFEGSVVFVGTSAIGLVDLRATPMGVQFPGVEVHANVFEGLLQPDLLHYRPDFWQGGVLLYLLLTGFILSLVMPSLGPGWMAVTGVSTLALTIFTNFWLWNSVKMALPMASSILLVMLITSYNIARGFFEESQKRQQIKSIFDQYVPPAHIDKMLNAPDDVSMDGERKELSVLFSDIRSFTNISEKLSANELKRLLNQYFNPITEAIFNHQGTIDKYVGDMVMAFWGAPLDDEKHAQHAVEAAFTMLTITHELAESFKEQGWPEVKIGIGINTGNMNVGDMGSSFRRAYTVLGDSVNLGSRLEGLTKFYGVECLVSEFTMSQCPDITFKAIDRVKVKGKETAVSIYQPIDPKDMTEDKQQELVLHAKAYKDYLARRWDEANNAFKHLQQRFPDIKLNLIYLERIAELRQQQLPDDWDGSFTHTSK